jgi:endonuclease YncB( thermonuclease family)
MQATTPTTHSAQPASLGPLIWVQILNDKQQAAARLDTEWKRLYQLKKTPAREALIDALLEGQMALERKARECANEARERGLLPYCWAGTKVLEGGAA